MTDNPYFLALDYGTQSVRALVFDLHGSLIAKAQIIVDPYIDDEAGAAIQEPDYCYRQLVDVVVDLFANSQVTPNQIKAVALTTQRACTVLFDDAGNAISPIYMWSDRRLASRPLPKMSWYFRLGFAISGLSRRIKYLRSAAKVNFIHQVEPQKLTHAAKVGMFSGYLLQRMTGHLIDSRASQVGYLPFDYKRQAWASTRSWRWQALAVRPNQMVSLISPAECAGDVAEHFAQDSGLPTHLPIFAAGGDKACEMFATGCGEAGVVTVSLGSAAVIALGTNQYREAYRYLPAFPSLKPQAFMTELQLERGFWLLSWLIKEFGQAEVIESQRLGISAEQLISRLIDDVPIGAKGLMLSPTWAQGVIYPGPEARGSIVGFTPEHNRLCLYRAAIEGILLTLKSALIRLSKISQAPINLIRVSGGGAQSDIIMQMCADVFDLPVERLHIYEASGLGAAMCCAVGAGYYGDVEAARREMTHIGQRFEPIATHVVQYQHIFKIYKTLYPQIKPFYKAQS